MAELKHLEKGNQKVRFDVFNLGTGKGSSVLEVIESFIRISGIELPYLLGPRRAGDIIAAYASIEKAKNHLNWLPKLSLDEAVRSAWNWEKENYTHP